MLSTQQNRTEEVLILGQTKDSRNRIYLNNIIVTDYDEMTIDTVVEIKHTKCESFLLGVARFFSCSCTTEETVLPVAASNQRQLLLFFYSVRAVSIQERLLFNKYGYGYY